MMQCCSLFGSFCSSAMTRWTSSALSRILRHARAGARAAAGQLASDLRNVTCLQVAREFAPNKLWQDFRRLSLHTQARCALLAYFCAGTAGLYGYLRYSQVKRQREWAEVVATWK